MTPAESARLLDLPLDATIEQLEARFLDLRRKLEDKIAKAPTPGLQAKYRASLAEITEAFETLTLAADGGSLPVLERSAPASPVERAAPSARAETAAATSAPTRPAQPAAKAKSNREFLIVAVIAVLVLGAGGWWIVKTRADNAERVRVETAAKAEAEAELARLRGTHAELNVKLEAILRTERDAERELAELRNVEKELAREKVTDALTLKINAAQVSAQNAFVTWLRETLPAHPATLAKVKSESMLSARALNEAREAIAVYAEATAQLQTEMQARRPDLADMRRSAFALERWREVQTADDAGRFADYIIYKYQKQTVGIPDDAAKAVSLWQAAAEKNNPGAMTNLGFASWYGQGTAENKVEALNWWKKAAELGEGDAMVGMAFAHNDGVALPKDQALVFEWYQKGAEKGSAWAMAQVARRYASGSGVTKDESEAVRWFQRSIDGGGAQFAQISLGSIYYDRSNANDAAKALKLWQDRVALGGSGAASAMSWIGRSALDGLGQPQSDAEAVKWYRMAADRGLPASMAWMASFYSQGRGVPKDVNEAARWTKQAAEKDHLFSMLELGDLYADGHGVAKDVKLAVQWWQKAAERNYAPAMVKLGEAYLRGLGVEKDQGEARGWWRRAAERNNADAMNRLGNTAPTPEEAVSWWEKGAALNYKRSIESLSLAYATGRGVPKDKVKAIEIMQKAIPEEAKATLGLGRLLSVDSDPTFRAEGIELLQKAAELGEADAMETLGHQYRRGDETTPKDPVKAAHWYRRAAEAGDREGMIWWATSLRSGKGVTQDHVAAVRWFRKLGDLGDKDGMFYLGVAYNNGEGVSKDLAEAARWFQKGAELGEATCMQWLGDAYEDASGVEKNLSKAIEWWRKAAAAGNVRAKERLAKHGIHLE